MTKGSEFDLYGCAFGGAEMHYRRIAHAEAAEVAFQRTERCVCVCVPDVAYHSLGGEHTMGDSALSPERYTSVGRTQ